MSGMAMVLPLPIGIAPPWLCDLLTKVSGPTWVTEPLEVITLPPIVHSMA